jgi:hypothetical protein
MEMDRYAAGTSYDICVLSLSYIGLPTVSISGMKASRIPYDIPRRHISAAGTSDYMAAQGGSTESGVSRSSESKIIRI